MNKKIVSIALVIIILIAAAFVWLLTTDNKTSDSSQRSGSSSQSESGLESAPRTNASAGSYVDYSDDVIAKTTGTKLLFFHASWCPQCRALEADISQNGVPANTTIIKVDYDTSQSLRQKHGVTLQTTVVKIDDQGNTVEKFVAYDDPTVAAIKENLL